MSARLATANAGPAIGSVQDGEEQACKYAALSKLTAYRRGCRCDRCRQAKAEAHRAAYQLNRTAVQIDRDLYGEIAAIASLHRRTIRSALDEAVRLYVERERRREEMAFRRRYPAGTAY